jgi:hypothetical protein
MLESYLHLSTSCGYDGEQVCNVSKTDVNGHWKYLRYYKNFNIRGYTEADTRVTKIALLIRIE